MADLILVRHGVTDWNVKGFWHGLKDIPLNEQGREQARETAQALKGIKIDQAYTSNLVRTEQTYQEICNFLGLSCPVNHETALNERDYGIYSGKNKWAVEKEVGEKKFKELRRGFNTPIPQGETLKDVYNRVIPFYQETLLKDLKEGKNVLIVSSGNTLRALIKYLDKLTDVEVANLEFEFGQVYIYSIDQAGEITKKVIKSILP